MANNVDKYTTEADHALIDHTGLPGVGGGGGPSVQAQANAGPIEGPQPTLNFIPAGAAGITVVENVGMNRIDITITATDTDNDTIPDLAEGRAGTIPLTAGTHSVGTSWPAGFLPRGLILVTASAASNFICFGAARGNTGGLGGQAYLVFNPGGTITSSGGLVASFGGSTLSALTPMSNNWNVQRTGASADNWFYCTAVIGGI